MSIRALRSALCLSAAGAVLALAAGCATIGYYGQAVRGHLDIMGDREDIAALIADPATEPALRARLELAAAARAFAVSDLALPDNDSYSTYVALDRNYVVANVVATPALSLDPVTWCFPVAGCVAYRGYFDAAEAEAFAATLAGQGLDVAVGRSSAYSTLGWFDDPLPSTILFGSETRLVGTIFHELAHQRVYVEDDSAFNEGYAVAVENEGIRRWLAAHGTSADIAAWQTAMAREDAFLALVLGARDRLVALYLSATPDAEKQAAKRAILAGLQADYQVLRGSWGGYAGYDGWFDRPLNNAHFAQLATYNDTVAAFGALLREQGGDMAAFHAAVAALAELPRAERDARLAALAGG